MSSLQELRDLQAARWQRQKDEEEKKKQDELDKIHKIKLEEFIKKVQLRMERERIMKETNDPRYYASRLVKFVKPWFLQVPNYLRQYQRRDLFKMPEGFLITIDDAIVSATTIGYDTYSEVHQNRFKRLLKGMSEDRQIVYWQDRDYERGLDMSFFTLECFIPKFCQFNIENAFVPLFDLWVKAFPMEDPFEFMEKQRILKTKDEDNIFKVWRLMRIIIIISQPNFTISWNTTVSIEIFSNYLYEELTNALNSIIRINTIQDEPVIEEEIKCSSCDTTREEHWVFAYNHFRVCRFCARNIEERFRTEIYRNPINSDDEN